MSIESGLYAKVTGNAGVSALIGTRLYPLVLPQNPTLPAASYQVISGDSAYTIGTQAAQIRKPRFQISAWASSYDTAKSVIRAIRTALDHQTASWSGVTVLGVVFEGEEIDFYDSETKEYQITAEVIITHL